MNAISVTHSSGSLYRVVVEGGGSSTLHDVTLTPEHVARYAPGSTAERLLKASFEFLLEREPKEAILSRFELSIIERYFPEYSRMIASYL